MPFNTATKKGPTGTLSDCWLTPKHILDALGEFDLDPCACPTWQTATNLICLPDDGLTADWQGRVFCNPPYSNVAPWLAKCAQHGNSIVLVYGRTDTQWFQQNAPRASAINFLSGRVNFLHRETMKPGQSPAPSILMAFGEPNVEAISRLKGMVTRPAMVK